MNFSVNKRQKEFLLSIAIASYCLSTKTVCYSNSFILICICIPSILSAVCSGGRTVLFAHLPRKYRIVCIYDHTTRFFRPRTEKRDTNTMRRTETVSLGSESGPQNKHQARATICNSFMIDV